MQSDKISIDVLQDDLAPVPTPRVDPEPIPSKELPADAPEPPKSGCDDPECPVCRWVPVIQEIKENIVETDVFMNMVEGGYPAGFSFFMMPQRVDAEESMSIAELMEGLEEATQEEKNLVVPAARVPVLFSALNGVLDENDDFAVLTFINDQMLVTALSMLGKALDPKTPEDRVLAETWYRNMRAQDPRTNASKD